MKRSTAKTARPRSLAELTKENTSLRRELELFRALAYRDPLTGLWNRRFFEERLAEEMARATRLPGRTLTLVVLDVDDLKHINDVHGHTGGDRALAWVGQFLRGAVRSHDLSCRTGGDEFTLIFPDVGAGSSSILVARLRHALEDANDGRRVPVWLSFGAASFPDHGTTPERLIEAADAAMYADKRAHKGESVHTPPPVPPSAARA